MFALSANAADGTVGTVSVQKGNNVSVNGEAPVSLTLDGKDPQSCQFLSKRAPDENHEFTWKEVTTTRGGELAEILGDQKEEIDSLVINGPVNSADFETLFHSSLYGYLSAINLKGAELENNAVPAYAFYRDGLSCPKTWNASAIVLFTRPLPCGNSTSPPRSVAWETMLSIIPQYG